MADLERSKANVRYVSLFEPGVSDRDGCADGSKLLRLPTQAMPHRGTGEAARRELALLSAIPVDEDGKGYLPDHGWYMIGIQVSSAEWRKHLFERQQSRHLGSLRAWWHRVDDWFTKGLNLTASVVVQRDLIRELRQRKRQADVGQAAPRHRLQADDVGVNDIFFLEAYAGTAPLSRCFLRHAAAMAGEAALEADDREQDDTLVTGDEDGDGGGAASAREQVFVQALDWTGTVGHGVGSLPMSKGQMSQLGPENFTSEDWLNTSCDPAFMPETIRLSPPRPVRAAGCLMCNAVVGRRTHSGLLGCVHDPACLCRCASPPVDM